MEIASPVFTRSVLRILFELRGVVLLWAGRGMRALPHLMAQTIVKAGLGPSIFSDEKGPK